MLCITYDETRTPDKGQFYLELAGPVWGQDAHPHADRGLCNRLGYWCDEAHLQAWVSTIQHKIAKSKEPKVQQYRKKRIQVEAMQLTRENAVDIGRWIYGHDFDRCNVIYKNTFAEAVMIYTPEGDMRADLGDWIVRGIKGEFYPVKPDVFEATYEAVTP